MLDSAPSWVEFAGLSISMPSVRYDPHQLRSHVAALGFATRAIENELR